MFDDEKSNLKAFGKTRDKWIDELPQPKAVDDPKHTRQSSGNLEIESDK